MKNLILVITGMVVGIIMGVAVMSASNPKAEVESVETNTINEVEYEEALEKVAEYEAKEIEMAQQLNNMFEGEEYEIEYEFDNKTYKLIGKKGMFGNIKETREEFEVLTSDAY